MYVCMYVPTLGISAYINLTPTCMCLLAKDLLRTEYILVEYLQSSYLPRHLGMHDIGFYSMNPTTREVNIILP